MPSPMNITIVQGAFLPVPPLAGGAVEKLWSDLGREFARRGLRVTHISRRWPGLPTVDVRDGVHHHRVRGFDYPRSPVLAKLMDLVYSIRCLRVLKRSDIVITNTFFLPLLLSLAPRRGLIYVSVHRYPQGQMRWYGRVDRLQCVSTAIADAVREQAPAVAPLVRVVPNYVSHLRDPAETEATWSRREKALLFVGRVHPEKGVDLLIRAFAAVPQTLRRDWRLVIVGPHEIAGGGGGGSYLDGLKELARSLAVDVEWVGPVFDPQALGRQYQRARAFAYPSIAARGEAFPLAPLEAMAQGCAVITSDLKCFDDYVVDGQNANTFPVGAPDPSAALAQVLTRLLPDEAAQRRYSAAGLATAARFTLPGVADSFIDDFKQLATS